MPSAYRSATATADAWIADRLDHPTIAALIPGGCYRERASVEGALPVAVWSSTSRDVTIAAGGVRAWSWVDVTITIIAAGTSDPAEAADAIDARLAHQGNHAAGIKYCKRSGELAPRPADPTRGEYRHRALSYSMLVTDAAAAASP